MQKAKFKISGMNCHSCASLIDEKLKNKPGILKAKTSFDSGKAVVVYDEQKIKESEIIDAINEKGEYKIDKEIEEEEWPKEQVFNSVKEQAATIPQNNKILSYIKILTIITIISFLMNAYLASALFKQLPKNSIDNKNIPSQNVQAKEPDSAIQSFEITQNDHIRGNENAKITLVEFSDFECPFCEKHYSTLKKILNDYSDKVRLIYKYFPLPFHQNAQKAAEAAECASEQGKFWEYHDKLFDSFSQGYSIESFKTWAKELGLNTLQFDNCLDSDKYSQRVQDDLKEGSNKGVNGTPATFINGQLISGAQPYESFKQIIDALL